MLKSMSSLSSPQWLLSFGDLLTLLLCGCIALFAASGPHQLGAGTEVALIEEKQLVDPVFVSHGLVERLPQVKLNGKESQTYQGVIRDEMSISVCSEELGAEEFLTRFFEISRQYIDEADQAGSGALTRTDTERGRTTFSLMSGPCIGNGEARVFQRVEL